MAQSPQKPSLGRGLSALMENDAVDVDALAQGGSPTKLAIDRLVANPFQPRHHFDPESMRELIDSVKEKGIIQPLLVRKSPQGDHYQIIAGERRWRAAQRAGLHEVPVVIKPLNDSEALELGIIENVQREDLSSVEEAAGYSRLIQEFGHTQEQVARLVGKSRSHIANLLRLMTLPDQVIEMVEDGRLTMGHARALVGVENATTTAKLVVSKGLSVRATEKLTQNVKGAKSSSTTSAPRKDTNTISLERDLSARLGLTLEINHGHDDSGEVKIKYKSLEQLDLLCTKLRS